ncbi:MAG TPA: hypothetical protein PKD64_11380 [Pirellulaceae bacterium]|nr:hypothetical protein [Pirellulaceae bacterium]HMO92784.1 hypothetical protein [Pirellulaceae bacterium]HMP69366.1 hypothetical protein [Pirellulaceae bacterium]
MYANDQQDYLDKPSWLGVEKSIRALLLTQYNLFANHHTGEIPHKPAPLNDFEIQLNSSMIEIHFSDMIDEMRNI